MPASVRAGTFIYDPPAMPRAAQKVEMLSNVPIFQGLSKKELAAILRSGREVEHPSGRAITQEGRSGIGFHLILEGVASVTARRRRVAEYGPGDYFGEMSLLDGRPRSATVRAETELKTLSLASWEFQRLIERYPSIARKMLIEMSGRIRNLQDSLTH